MKKILFMVTQSISGGAQKWTKEQMQLCAKEFEVFLATDQEGWLSHNVVVKDSFLDMQIHKRFSFSYFMRLLIFVKKFQIDLIVASSANAGVYARMLKLVYPKAKVIYVSHGWSSLYNGGRLSFLYIFVEKQLAKLSDSILCISQNDYNNAKSKMGIDNKRLMQITNKIYPLTNKREKENIQEIKVLAVARLTPPKRLDLLIHAAIVCKLQLYIVGDGILRAHLENIADTNIHFLGEISGFQDFGSYDIFALISDSEGLPLSALEAMSVSMPLVLSNTGGCSELIENNGVLVNNKITDIAQGLKICIENRELFAKKSYALFEKNFNLANDEKIYLDYYKKFLV